ncbi:MAG: hypothetical protein JKX81_02500 [Arenicella sp.]|nr:hypothetical protein [Arenicella sp.]
MNLIADILRLLTLMVLLFLHSDIALSEADQPHAPGIIISIDARNEVREAHILRTLYYTLPENFHYCLDKSPGEISYCSDENLDQLNRQLLDAMLMQYCRTVELYPEWEGKAPNYKLKNNIRGYAINFPTMVQRLVNVCPEF